MTTTIVDDDPSPTLVISDVAITEGNTGTANAVFAVTLSTVSGRSVTVNYATANGTAVAPNDYTAAPGTLTFAPGTTSQTIAVPVVGDTLDEPVETFVVDLTSPTGATIADAQGVATITDNDPAVSIVIGNVTVAEGNSGTANASFPVTLSAAERLHGHRELRHRGRHRHRARRLHDAEWYAHVRARGDEPERPGADRRATCRTKRRRPSSSTSAPRPMRRSRTTRRSARSPTTIRRRPIAIGDVTITEGNSGTANASFPVTLSAPSSFTVTVVYATANGTATASGDYSTRSGTVTFSAWHHGADHPGAHRRGHHERANGVVRREPELSVQCDDRRRAGDWHHRRQRHRQPEHQQRVGDRRQQRHAEHDVHGHQDRRHGPDRHGGLRDGQRDGGAASRLQLAVRAR